jgi:hypothetical protein
MFDYSVWLTYKLRLDYDAGCTLAGIVSVYHCSQLGRLLTVYWQPMWRSPVVQGNQIIPPSATAVLQHLFGFMQSATHMPA